MAMPDWIERSLERLEWLEAERERIAAEGPSAAAMLAEHDTEIATLYEALESAAGEDEVDGPPSTSDWAPMAVPEDSVADAGVPIACTDGDQTLTFIEHVGWTTFRDLDPLPADAPPMAVTPPLGDGVDFVVDEQWNGGSIGWRWMIPAAAALLMFVGLGTWLGLQPNEAVASTPIEASATTPERIEAAAIPDDTQEPIAARGIDAERTPSMELDAAVDASKPDAPRQKKAHRAGRERAGSSSSHAIDLGKSREPLAGL